ncbi:heme utilization cystosolic carrier protein HutX [Neorhizobium galegae]|uniref:heme utilization cystosolic carrier protein HutX n=1 Tax=Neorhizobium galegae TaxID=399 RepID=UPI0006227231|nr:heme utilization cystosolic carrier protein HutX [Neorhizobium galegae]MCQ1571212.1 heme utilization cystosolic carrier protein HutX [Neorhizobium galegae]UIK04140.1 heme utilization cystosolic carrier protein HutX [Neorhizobium galegae]CDZ69322.1 Heme utilization protein HuvX [Neorhizobium galegae bv. orientalis]
MNAVSEISPDRHARALAALAEKPDGVVEAIAANAEVTPAEILEILPKGAAVIADKEKFADIWAEMTTWGEVLFIVHTEDIVLEAEGTLPMGSEGHGWFNIHGDSPIGGHIKKENCASVTFVDRAFHGRRSCSVWFMNAKGSAMFKVFVKRDAARELIAEQLQKFEALRDSYA